MKPGFLLAGEHYSFPSSYTFGEAMLVGRLTRKGMYEFAEDLQAGTDDPANIAAIVAVAVWKKNPEWSIDDAEAFVMNLDMENFRFSKREDDSSPPPSGSVEQPESTDSPDNAAE